MVQEQLTKVSARTAAEVAGRFALGEDAKKLLRDAMSPAEFLGLLRDKGQWIDAIRFIAYGLPKREAVWWAAGCAREASGANPEAKIAAALKAVDAWIADPTEPNRRACMKAAEAAEISTPAGCACLAAFFSGGSLGPPEAPVVPPGEFHTAHAASGAVMLSAVVSEPEKAAEKHKRFVARAIEIANGPTPWKASPAAPASAGAGSPGAATAAPTTRPTLPPLRRQQ